MSNVPPVTTTTPYGHAMTPAEAAAFLFDKLVPFTAVGRAGFRTVTTPYASITIPQILSDPQAAWVGEAEEIPLSAPDGAAVTIQPKKCSVLVRTSNEMLYDANPAGGTLDILALQLTRALTDSVDFALFNGGGSAVQPRGLNLTPGLSHVDGDPASAIDLYTQAIGIVENMGGIANTILCSPDTWVGLAQIKDAEDSNRTLLSPDGRPTADTPRVIQGCQIVTSVHCHNEDGSPCAYVLPADQCVLVWRQVASIVPDPSAGFTSDTTYVRGIVRLEFAYPNPAAVVKISEGNEPEPMQASAQAQPAPTKAKAS